MSATVKVQYVGNKPHAFDNVANSCKTWTGFGDIQEVTESQAAMLTKYPDQWMLVDEADAPRVEAPTNIKVVDEDGDTVIIDPEYFKKPIEQMTKAEIVAYAKEKFGKDVSVNLAKKDLIDTVEEFERDLDVSAGPRAD